MLIALRSTPVSQRQSAPRSAVFRKPRRIAPCRSADPKRDVGSDVHNGGGVRTVTVPALAESDVALLVDAKPLHASKALVGLLSPELRHALSQDPDCRELKVEGSERAWRFILDFPFMSTQARKAAVADPASGCDLIGDVLSTALMYGIEPLVQEAEEVFTAWQWQNLSAEATTESTAGSPNSPLWWIDLADKYQRLELSAPAILALVNWTSHRNYEDWDQGRLQALEYGRARQQRSSLWRQVVRLIEWRDC